MKKKRALAILLAVSLLPSTLAGCGKKEEPAAVEEETQEEAEEESVYQEFDFYSDDESLIMYNFPEEYSISGKTYKLMEDVDYETLGTRDVVQMKVDMAVEDMDEIPETYEYESKSGKTYELANEQVYVKTKGIVQIPVTEEVHYDKQYGRPSPAATKMITYYDKDAGEDKEIEGTLKDFQETTPDTGKASFRWMVRLQLRRTAWILIPWQDRTT